MPNLVILDLKTLVALGTYIVISRIYLRPWFAGQPIAAAVLPLLLLHAFRCLCLTLMVPGQIDSSVPMSALQIMVWAVEIVARFDHRVFPQNRPTGVTQVHRQKRESGRR